MTTMTSKLNLTCPTWCSGQHDEDDWRIITDEDGNPTALWRDHGADFGNGVYLYHATDVETGDLVGDMTFDLDEVLVRRAVVSGDAAMVRAVAASFTALADWIESK